MLCYLYANCLFESLINPSLSYKETRFVKVLSVTDDEIELTLDNHKLNGTFMTPEESQNPSFKILFKDFEKVYGYNINKVFLCNDALTNVYILNLTEYESKYNYVYSKMRLEDLCE